MEYFSTEFPFLLETVRRVDRRDERKETRVEETTVDDEVHDRMRNGDSATRNRISDTGAR